jgi:hypothetical protein
VQVLIVKKPRNMAASSKLRDISSWLTQKGIKVYVEHAVHTAETPQVRHMKHSFGLQA